MPIDVSSLPDTKEHALAIGSKFYFTGIKCANGHISERRSKTGACVQCQRDKSNEWHAKKRSEGGEWINDRSLKKIEAQSQRWHEDAAWRAEVTAVRQGWRKDKMDGDPEYKSRFLRRMREKYATDQDYRSKVLASVKAYQQRRRENEEFESFMDRMEKEAAEWEAANNGDHIEEKHDEGGR